MPDDMMIFAIPKQWLFGVLCDQFDQYAHSVNIRRDPRQSDDNPITAFKSGYAGDCPAGQKVCDWLHTITLCVKLQFSRPLKGSSYKIPAKKIISQLVANRKNSVGDYRITY